MKHYASKNVTGPMWQGRQSERILRDTIVHVLNKKPCTPQALADYLEWPLKLFMPHIKALKRKGRIQELSGVLFTKKSLLIKTVIAIKAN